MNCAHSPAVTRRVCGWVLVENVGTAPVNATLTLVPGTVRTRESQMAAMPVGSV